MPNTSMPSAIPPIRSSNKCGSGARSGLNPKSSTGRRSTQPSMHCPEFGNHAGTSCNQNRRQEPIKRAAELRLPLSLNSGLSTKDGNQSFAAAKRNDGATVIPETEALVGNTLDRILADKGSRGHKAPPDHKFKISISGQTRAATPKIKRQLR